MTSDPTAQATPPDHDWDWTSDGKYSLDELARNHTTNVATLLWKTLATYTQPALNTYIDSGLWTALVPAGIIIRFPAGH